MELFIGADAGALGAAAGKKAAEVIRKAISERGSARIILSTGMSQFETLEHLTREDIEWGKVEMFHLDEYVGLPEDHPASFRKYLRERFLSKVEVKAAHLVDGTAEQLPILAEEFRKAPIDLGLIGIGENGHIAFNDPPADFDTDEVYRVVELDAKCRAQQVGEGWFKNVDEVPEKAVSMSCKAIMSCRTIISAVPHAVKAWAVKATLEAPSPTPMVPASLLKTHPDWHLFVDEESYALAKGTAT